MSSRTEVDSRANSSHEREHATVTRYRSTRLLHSSMALVALGLAGYVGGLVTDQDLLNPRYSPHRQVDLTEPSAPADTPAMPASPDSDLLVMAVAPVISPERSVPLYDGLVRYLAARVGRKPVLLQGSSYAETNDLVRQGRCDVAFVCTYAFVVGERSFGMQLLAAPIIQGSDTYQSLLVAPVDSGARSLLDFRGKRFASADPLSWSGSVYTATSLIAAGEDPHRFFGEQLVVGSHDRAIRVVALGLADGASVDSLVYEEMVRRDPELERRLEVVQSSPRFGMPPLVVPARIDPRLREQLLEALLGMSRSPEGTAVLQQLGIDRFVVPPARQYDDVRSGASVWEGRR